VTGRIDRASRVLANGVVRVVLTDRVCASVFLVRVAERRIAREEASR
jgi:hypothetical protein